MLPRHLARRAHILWICIIATLPASFALAADPKPDATLKNKAFEGSVYLDDKIKADPALAADSLAEGRKLIAKKAAEAERERKQEPELFRERGWSFERRYNFRSLVDGRYLSIVRADYEYTGGAHPNSWSDTILWDQTAKKRINIRRFFNETADNGPTLKAMRQGVIASLKAEKKKRGAEGIDEGAIEAIEPKLLKIGPIALAPSTVEGKSSGLSFYYAPYAVGSYAEGEYAAFVPWETLKPYLSPEGVTIFGGARPKGDADGMQ
ncbi:PdaC/SigV domain-containing protein [Bradyrhizobium sp.]|uniref:PdaC/SigV domain-containing protein n=1 Tax=Bradyrhizobium sp. TaxID=376 RepID=UPI0040376969